MLLDSERARGGEACNKPCQRSGMRHGRMDRRVKPGGDEENFPAVTTRN